jgi:hypothetical protein
MMESLECTYIAPDVDAVDDNSSSVSTQGPSQLSSNEHAHLVGIPFEAHVQHRLPNHQKQWV